jgi:cell division protein ZapA (FtsZ GTPase activity inhibitor)
MGQNIKIKIGNNEYSLVASSPEIESAMREAAGQINKTLANYDAKYPTKSLSDKLSFVALSEATARVTLQRRLKDVEAEGARLAADVDSYIKNIEKDGR